MQSTTSFFDHQNTFQLVILAGAIIAVIFLFISPFFIKAGQRKKIYLMLFVASLGMNNLSNYMIDINLHAAYPIIPLLPLPITLMIPVSCYFYLHLVLDSTFKISFRGKMLISFVLAELVFYLLLMMIYGVENQLITDNPTFIKKLFQLKEFVTIFITLLLAGDIILKFYSKSKQTQSKTTKSWHRLAKYILVFSLIIVFTWTCSYVYGFFVDGFSRKAYYPIWCISTFVIVFAGWHALSRSEKNPVADLGSPNDRAQLERLQQLVISQKLYKQSKLTLKGFSNLSGVSSIRITHVLKRNNENFNSFINQYRVEEAKRLLLEQDYFKYTMDFICEEAGFNSRASFFSIFKAVAGKTPKQFREESSGQLISQESKGVQNS